MIEDALTAGVCWCFTVRASVVPGCMNEEDSAMEDSRWRFSVSLDLWILEMLSYGASVLPVLGSTSSGSREKVTFC